MKKASLILALVAVLAVSLPANTVLAATVSTEISSTMSAGCSAGDTQIVTAWVEWSGGSGGYGSFEAWFYAEGGLLGYDINDNPTLPAAFSQYTGGMITLPSDLADGTIIKVDVALTVDSDVARQTAFYACGTNDFWLATEGPGPDMVPIPTQAVVGTFTTATPLYFAPTADGASSYVMEAGQSLWVYGVNEAGTFYKVLLSGKTYWVPVANIGPTYDDVWNGTPLPGTVVE